MTDTTINIKKPFIELVQLLEANKDAAVSEVMAQVYELAKASTSPVQNASIIDEDGNVVAVFCFYHKRFEIPTIEVEYGSKKGTKTGLNSMCKEGVNAWTKRNKQYKDGLQGLAEYMISDEASAEMEAEGISMKELLDRKKAELEAGKSVIIPREDGKGYDTEEEAKEAYYAATSETK